MSNKTVFHTSDAFESDFFGFLTKFYIRQSICQPEHTFVKTILFLTPPFALLMASICSTMLGTDDVIRTLPTCQNVYSKPTHFGHTNMSITRSKMQISKNPLDT